MRHAASLQRPRGLHRRGLRAWWWVTVGGGIFARNREDPVPTVGIAIRIAPKCRPLPSSPCVYHATRGDVRFFVTTRRATSL